MLARNAKRLFLQGREVEGVGLAAAQYEGKTDEGDLVHEDAPNVWGRRLRRLPQRYQIIHGAKGLSCRSKGCLDLVLADRPLSIAPYVFSLPLEAMGRAFHENIEGAL